MSYELTGKLIAKYETAQKSETFKTRDFVVEKSEDTNGRVFTSFVKFQCTQDRTAIVDRVNIGDEVKVHFNIRGTKWEKEGKVSYFTNLDAWRIETVAQGSEAASDDGHLEPLPTFSSSSSEAVDDLPF